MDGESPCILTNLDCSESEVSLGRNPQVIARRPLTRGRKWPVIFWAILKVLGLYHHRTVITRRRCYLCSVKSRMTRLKLLSIADPECDGSEAGDLNLDQLILAYETDSDENWQRNWFKSKSQREGEVCKTCKAQWWNRYGVPVVYTEEEIGVTRWNHRGSGLLSIIMIITNITVLTYNGIVPIYQMWGRPVQILHLMTRMTLISALSIYPILVVFSKFRSTFRNGLPTKFSWATVLNVRYLIKQGQFLNLPRKGLPGKTFLVMCLFLPVAVMTYRTLIMVYIGSCDVTVYMAVTSAVSIIFLETWSLFNYILYFVRVSFERQFNLQLGHIKEHAGQARECRSVLLATAADFACFKELVDRFTVLAFPCQIFAIVANISYDYLLGSNDCIWEEKGDSLRVQIHLAILAWAEIGTTFLLYLLSIGGFHVGYMWKRFSRNLLHLGVDGTCPEFWKALLRDTKYFETESKVLITTIIFSVIGVWAGLGIGNQSIVYLSGTCTMLNQTEYVC